MRTTLVLLLIALSAATNLRRLSSSSTPGDIASKTEVSPANKQKISGMDKFNNFCDSINKVADTYQNVVNAFKSSYSKSMRIIPQEGFKLLKMTSNVFIAKGLKEERYLKYFQGKEPAFHLTGDKKIFFEQTVEDGMYCDQNDWNQLKVIYEDGKDDNTFDNINVYISIQDSGDKFDVILLYMTGEFGLADDILYIQESKSIAGGIYSSSKDSMEKVPHHMSQKEAEALINFYNILSVKFVSSTIGIKLNLPEI